jgi:hydroxymethylpyrimidine pyrophosphatase-like HAD family hydrolase
MIHKPIPDTCYLLYSANGGDNPDFHARLKMYRNFASCISAEALDNFGGATQILCIVPVDRGHQVAAEIAGTLKQCSVIKATSPLDGVSLWVEIFAPTVCKSNAVRWLAETIGLQPINICAVGNDYNDVDLLRWAGQSFLVANGPPSLQPFFPCVASNDNGGVSEAAARWLAANN